MNANDLIEAYVSDVAAELQVWQACVLAARSRLVAQADLCTRLIGFVAKKR